MGAAVVAFESPRRLRASLTAIGERWPARRLAVCRELTKLHEEVLRGSASEVLGRLAETVRGEIVLVLEPVGTAGAAGPLPGNGDFRWHGRSRERAGRACEERTWGKESCCDSGRAHGDVQPCRLRRGAENKGPRKECVTAHSGRRA